MDINKYQGSKGKQIGDLLYDLHRRIEQLETADRLTRTHPVTGSDDFVGTVFRTPSNIPVFIVSESGLESPWLSGSPRLPIAAPPSADISVLDQFQNSGQWRIILTSTFIGTYSDMVEMPMSTRIVADEGGWEIQYRGVFLEVLPSGAAVPIGDVSDSFITTQQNSATAGGATEAHRSAKGIWRIRHGAELDITRHWEFRIEARMVSDTGTVQLTEAEVSLPDYAVQRGVDTSPQFNATAPFTSEATLVSPL